MSAIRESIARAGGRIAASAYVAESAALEAPVDIADSVTFYGKSSLGRFSYLNVGCVVYHNVSIGRFCSIGRLVEIGLAKHPVDFLSTHPFQFAQSPFSRAPGYTALQTEDWQFHAPTKVGHDIWIGAKAAIASGVTVAHGAVVAAGAVVVNDVNPYEIVGGVPARVIRRRFSDAIVDELLALRWWDMDIKYLAGLSFRNIQDCLGRLKEIRHDLDSLNET